jgi:hypothetical protein
VEQLDAIEAVVTVPRSGRFRVVHGSAVR